MATVNPSLPRIYCASPLGFSEAGRIFLEQAIQPAFRAAGLAMVDPWTLTDPALIGAALALPLGLERRVALQRLNGVIGRNNQNGIQDAEGLFAVLDGVDVDSGTAAEIGFAAALDLPMLGYRGDFRLSADNEGGIVNLQVEHFLRSSGGGGGTIITATTELLPGLAALRARILARRATE